MRRDRPREYGVIEDRESAAATGRDANTAAEAADLPIEGAHGRGGQPRSTLRAVAVPIEHGGWGLTAEPVLLGLLVAPTAAGIGLGLAALMAFVARTPLKVLLVDAHRRRELDRTKLARRVLAGEGVVLVALIAVALRVAKSAFWMPLVVVGPLLAIELWFDMRSRSRRLIPELAGAVGITGVAAIVMLAGGEGGAVAVAVWLILIARSLTAIVTVRDQVGRLHGRSGHPRRIVAADLGAAALAIAAVAIERSAAAGAVAVVTAIVAQRTLAMRPIRRAVVLGLRQTVLGLFVVIVTAVGVFVA
jgi:hypothetical protein